MEHNNKGISQERPKDIYWKLFKSTFMISALTIGGGYVIIPLIKAKFVDEYHWLTDEEALNLVAIAQASPGVVAVNMAVIMGYRLAGWIGLCMTLLATLLPPLVIITAIAFFYKAFISNEYIRWTLKGAQIAATAVILKVAVGLLKNIIVKKEYLSICIAISAFVASYFFSINIMYIVIICAVIGFLCMRGETQ